jgi:nucleoside-diphosphate-sugar epimerase
MKKVLILGGNGYIGSRLRQVLRQSHFVKTNDICWFSHDETSDRRDYQKLTREELAEFEAPQGTLWFQRTFPEWVPYTGKD